MSEVDPKCRGLESLLPRDIINQLPRHKTKKYARRSPTEIGYVVVHTTDWNTTIEKVVKYDIGPNHISKTGCPGSTYHEFIMGNGEIYKALEDTEVSWHSGKWNNKSYAIALMYKCTNEPGLDQFAPPVLAITSLQTRAGDLCLQYGLDPDRVVGHRELKGTGWFWHKGSKRLRKSCPGKKLDMDDVRKNVATYMQCKLFMKRLYKGKIDGLWGRKSKTALDQYIGEQL